MSTDPSSPPDPSGRRACPAPLVVAASLAGLQGSALVVLAVVTVVTISSERVSLAASTAVFFALVGGGLLACAVSLSRLGGWARGPVLLAQLIQLGLAWNVRDAPLLAGALAVVAVVVVLGVIHPASMAALDPEAPSTSP